MILDELTWFQHSAFLWDRGIKIYLDPWGLPERPEIADIILITHDHHDHLSEQDLRKILSPKTVIVAPPDCQKRLVGNVVLLKAGESTTIQGVKITATPAYTMKTSHHSKEKAWVGYLVEVGGEKIYHAGDTDFIPEMNSIKTDLALLPIGGATTMNWEEAAKAAEAIQPRVAAIPMHFGAGVGSLWDAKKFAERVKVPVEILTPVFG
ncbi:MAG: MBL fold metallo-hydrolase [Deltaproteobacteria bacterium]|nr:MBL fold metallo-hydrolase [Deltaproteobacteria bacterium]